MKRVNWYKKNLVADGFGKNKHEAQSQKKTKTLTVKNKMKRNMAGNKKM